MRTCLVVPFYFGPRRMRSGYQTFKNVQDVIELCSVCYQSYSEWDSGCDTDIILVNNTPEIREASTFLKSIEGHPAFRGRFIVLNGNNIGMGFGAHSLAFDTFRDTYSYWMFTEDDVIINKPGLMKTAIHQLEGNPNIGFVACYGLAKDHAHGGIGCSSTKNLDKVWSKYGKLPHHESIPNLGDNIDFKNTHIIHGEVAFTKCYIDLGMKLVKVNSETIPYNRWDRRDSPHCNARDIDMWGQVAKCFKN